MKLEEVLQLEGIKIIDNNIITSGKMLEYLYDIKSLEDITPKLYNFLFSKLGFMQNKIFLFENEGVFTINEVAKEYFAFLEGVNSTIRFHERNKQLTSEERVSLNLLRAIGKTVYRVHRKVLSRDLVKTFSPEETERYKKLSEIIIEIAEHIQLEQCDKGYLKHACPLNLDTDEKIAAAALVASEKYPVSIFTNDKHIRLIFNFLVRYGDAFVPDKTILLPTHQIEIYYRTTINGEESYSPISKVEGNSADDFEYACS